MLRIQGLRFRIQRLKVFVLGGFKAQVLGCKGSRDTCKRLSTQSLRFWGQGEDLGCKPSTLKPLS